jgi:hypothetical protein
MQRCTTKTTQVGDSRATVENTCKPYDPTDVLLLVGLGGVLLLPDLAELEIAGVITLKRRVEQQAARQEQIEAHLFNLSQTVTQGLSVQFNIGALEQSAKRVEELAPALLEPVQATETVAPLDPAALTELPPGSPPEQLIAIARRLGGAAGRAESTGEDQATSGGTVRALRRWRELFGRDIAVVQAVAARAGSAPRPPEAEIRQATDLGLRLLDLLRQAVTAAESHEGFPGA